MRLTKASIDWRDVDIHGLTADSRAVEPGWLFAALPGGTQDGRTFIPQALSRGAAAILAETGTDLPESAGSVPLLLDDNPRRRLALLAARYHGRQPGTIAAVTGTNGKTSVARFLEQIWARLGHRSASLGTLGVSAPGFEDVPALTTPDPVALHDVLRRLDERHVDHLAMEASSHGLHQFRLDGVRLTAAAFTNLTQDHLDYHGTMQAYLDAKARLFMDLLPEGGMAVLNADSPEAAGLADRARARGLRVLSFGHGPALAERHAWVGPFQPSAQGQLLELTLDDRAWRVDLPLVGAFQASNAVCALCLATACGADPDRAVEALSHLTGVPGRMELAGRRDDGASVYVDYAHTPDALETVLTALRPHCAGRLSVVFGCGGDRDRAKRPMMGAIAARLADRVIVTDDNPRTEDPGQVRAGILEGCPEAEEIGDRRAAIQAAVAGLAADDLLLIAGKGHETGQTVGDRVLPFDDRVEARAALAGRNA